MLHALHDMANVTQFVRIWGNNSYGFWFIVCFSYRHIKFIYSHVD